MWSAEKCDEQETKFVLREINDCTNRVAQRHGVCEVLREEKQCS